MLSDVTRDNGSLRRFLHGLPGVDQVGAEGRAAALATRSIKTTAKAWAIDTAIRMVDLTTLEGADTPGKVRSLCAKARAARPVRPDGAAGRRGLRLPRPGRDRASTRCAAATVQVASVATAFPSGRAALTTKLHDVARRGRRRRDRDRHGHRPRRVPGRALPAGVRRDRRDEGRRAATAHLKVILETGELATLDNVRRASWLALLAGGDFIKTSTGKVSPAATPPVALVMLEAVRDFADRTGDAARREAGRRHPHHQGGRPLPRDGQRGRRRAVARPATCSASARPACSTTCCSSGTS